MCPEKDFEAFRELLAGTYAFYKNDLSDFALSLWWEAMRPYDLAAVQQAVHRHVMNPDSGQFLPKPADVVKMLAGRTVDGAQTAWAKVDRALRTVGTYCSVVFDDALIHRVLSDMGGWVLLGTKTEDEWPFVAREFETRYRGYAMRRETPEYPMVMTGICESDNGRRGYETDPPRLIGARERCMAIMAGGTDKPLLTVTDLGESVVDFVKRLDAQPMLGSVA